MPKPNLKEVSIFPNSCELGHNFVPYDDNKEDRIKGYYHYDGKGNAITTTVYATLYCTKCGETKEIAIVNRRR